MLAQLLTVLLFTSMSPVTATYIPTKACKASPGSPEWPSQDAWGHLNDTLGGRLIKPLAPAGVCHEGQPNFNETQCPAVAESWRLSDFHISDPVSIMSSQYSNDTCLPDPRAPCSTDGYPSFVVNATSPDDIKAGVNFAREHNVRLIVKSTGHDYLGRSTAPGALSIWTHHLNAMTYHEGSFKLAGSGKVIEGSAITVGSGTPMLDIYKLTSAHGQTAVGGMGASVGVTGYTSGGGHSIFSPRYGLGADNVLQVEIVTPSGELLTVNEDQHCDLFWALRGGGGSTFGVVTSITIKTFPSPRITRAGWNVFTAANSTFLPDLITYLFSQFPTLMDGGLSGYNFVQSSIDNPVSGPGFPKKISGVIGNYMLQDNDDPDAILKLIKPINETIHARWGGAVYTTLNITTYNSFMDWFSENLDPGSAGYDVYLRSRLLDRETLEGDQEALKQAIEPTLGNPTSGLQAFMLGGEGVRDAKPRGGSNSVLPAWRKAHVLTLLPQPFVPLNATAKEEAKELIEARLRPLKDLTPNSGSYLNEAYPYEDDWQNTFWGDNYERLFSIKRTVDPEDVFWCVPCVGNEGWEEQDDGRLCRV